MTSPQISIFALIYRSCDWAQFLYDALMKNTEELQNGEAEFFFVVNYQKGISDKVIAYLKEKNIPYFVFDKHPEQLQYPQNLPQIYESWNFGVEKAQGRYICPINSDMYPASGWLSELVIAEASDRLVSSRLVESGKMPSGWWAIPAMPFDFDKTPQSFNSNEFEKFVGELINVSGSRLLRYGGLFMPYLLAKDSFNRVGGYPLGNINGVPGDQIFIQKLKEKGINHITAMASIVWHAQEGESSE